MPLQKRVSELPAVATVAATDQLIVSSANATKRCTVQQIGAYFAANGVAGPQGPQGPSGASTWSAVTDKPSTFPPSAHQHVVGDVTGLQALLDGKQPSGSYATLVGGKVPESQLPPIVTTWEGLTGKPGTFPPSAHSHAIADVTGLQTALDGKQAAGSYAAAVHTHVIADVTGLQTALDGKQAAGSYAAASHGHAIADVSGLQTALDGKAALSHTHSALTDITGLATVATSGSAADLTGTLSASRLPTTTVTAGSYGSASSVGTFTVDATGRLTAAGSTAIAIAAGAVSGLATVATTGAYSDLSGRPTLGTAAAAATTDFAAASHTQAWTTITSTPTTLAGYGITDGVTTSDTRLASNGNKGDITVSSNGATWTINAGAVVTADLADNAVTTAKIADSAVTDAKISAVAASKLTGTVAVARLPTVLEQTVTGGNTSTSVTLSLASGSVQTWTLNGNCTFTMPAASAGASLTIILTQSGTFTASFTGVLWSGGTAPTITATNGKVDILVFVSNGTSWYGTALQNF